MTEEVDPAQVEHLRQKLLAEQNLPLGAAAGIVASLLGAAVWAAITVVTGYQIGFMAIGVGFLVGLAVRLAGRGLSVVFGVVGGVLALLGCAAGNLLAVTALVAQHEEMAFFDVVLRLDPTLAFELMKSFASPMDALFYAIAGYEGYQLSFRQLSPEELQQKLGLPVS
ncbi:MAG: hypothetical protein ACQGVC_25345 [Myxococcota bacterium]